MANKDTYDQFVAMFDIDDSLEEDSEQGSVADNSFDELSNVVAEDLSDVQPESDAEADVRDSEFMMAIHAAKVADIDPKKQDEEIIKNIKISKDTSESIQFDIEEPKKEETELDFDQFDAIPEQPERIEKEIEEEPISLEFPESEIIEETVQKPVAKPKMQLKIINNEVQWLLDSPSRLYDIFYSDKKEVIDSFTEGFHIPFKRWSDELIDCKVVINTEVFDNQTYIDQMSQIQNFLDRVKNIQIKVNNQYFLCDEFVPRLEGCLARVEYLKPSLKQDGLVYDHLKDILWYHAKLKHIHESAKGTMKTLEKAWETVSRKATLTTPSRPIEKYYRGQSRHEVLVERSREDLDAYDNLPDKAEVKHEPKKTDFCGWGDIG